MGNNPIMMVDPDGEEAKNVQEAENVDGNIPNELDADLKAAKRLMLESFKFDYVYGPGANEQWIAQGKGNNRRMLFCVYKCSPPQHFIWLRHKILTPPQGGFLK